MSSGVDSSIAAALLIRSGHPLENLQPFYMANWSPSANPPSIAPPRLPYNKPRAKNPALETQSLRGQGSEKCTEKEFNDVRDICQAMGLNEPLYMNFEKEYWNEVFMPMIETFQRGQTPNPDVECNRQIKFGTVLKRLEEEFRKDCYEKARKWWMATGKKTTYCYCSIYPHTPETYAYFYQATMLMFYTTSLQINPTSFVLVIQIKIKHSTSLQFSHLLFHTSFSHSVLMSSQNLLLKPSLANSLFQGGVPENLSAKKVWVSVS